LKVWLDVSVLRCPNCGSHYADASWYVIEMESDIQCGSCGKEFNSKKNATDRAILEFHIDDSGKIQKVKVAKRLELE
jgi:DNA-directed RNA polymerase subunit RPC12/RpoP